MARAARRASGRRGSTRVSGPGQKRAASARASGGNVGQPLGGGEVGDVHDQRVEGGPALGGEDAGDRSARSRRRRRGRRPSRSGRRRARRRARSPAAARTPRSLAERVTVFSSGMADAASCLWSAGTAPRLRGVAARPAPRKPGNAGSKPMTYRAPLAEMRFLLEHVLGAGRLAETARFAEATPETVDAVLAEAARLAEDVLAPLRRAGDLHPARLENGVVRTSPGFAEAYRQLADGRLGRHRGRPRARRHGAAGDARDLRRRDAGGGEPGALALPAALPRPDRGARAPRVGRAEGGLSAEAHRRRLDRDDEPDRAAGGLGRRRGAHAGPSRTATGPTP